MSIFKKVAKTVKKSARSVVREVSPYASGASYIATMPYRGFRDVTQTLNKQTVKARRDRQRRRGF